MIIQSVAKKIGEDPNSPTLKRNIYRDLKDLSLSQKLDVDYFSPDGRKLDLDEESLTKNVRIEYYVPGTQSELVGASLLEAAHARLMGPGLKSVDWKIMELNHVPLLNQYVLAFRAPDGKLLGLCSETDQRPLKLIIGRAPEKDLQVIDPSIVEEKYGRRAALLLLNEKSVSRSIKGERDGHVLLEIQKEENQIFVRDLSSTTGTLVATGEVFSISQLIRFYSDNLTRTGGQDPLHGQKDWKTITASTKALPLPVFLRLGEMTLVFAKSN